MRVAGIDIKRKRDDDEEEELEGGGKICTGILW